MILKPFLIKQLKNDKYFNNIKQSKNNIYFSTLIFNFNIMVCYKIQKAN